MSKNFSYLIFISLILASCVKEIKNNDVKEKRVEFALVVHGGAGYISKGRYTVEEEKEYKSVLEKALSSGYNILENDGTAVDAVETAIRILEDSPLFNAGKGAVFNDEGNVELDASIMYGKDINSGSVAGIKHIKNPITLARFVMEHSPHVMMFGDGAELFAEEFGLQKVDNSYFKTKNRIEEYNKNNNDKAFVRGVFNKFGTVGCAALDKSGNLAAGTSTGGIMGKKYGRVGDSPIIGAGTYANNETCALSATGQGEYFIRNVVAHEISALMNHKNFSIGKAADIVINKKLKEQGALGGIIGIDSYGNITMKFNTEGMFRGYCISKQDPVILLYK